MHSSSGCSASGLRCARSRPAYEAGSRWYVSGCVSAQGSRPPFACRPLLGTARRGDWRRHCARLQSVRVGRGSPSGTARGDCSAHGGGLYGSGSGASAGGAACASPSLGSCRDGGSTCGGTGAAACTRVRARRISRASRPTSRARASARGGRPSTVGSACCKRLPVACATAACYGRRCGPWCVFRRRGGAGTPAHGSHGGGARSARYMRSAPHSCAGRPSSAARAGCCRCRRGRCWWSAT
mmetsp:Transcript_36492/g.116211  ORF Transcript_36492/g.116211 Transcript_36492/m.116211 type:complete len:240 (-) Transcript_36492:8-727(-)